MPSSLTRDDLLTIFKAQYQGTNPIADSAIHFSYGSPTTEVTASSAFTSPTDDTIASRASLSPDGKRTLTFSVKVDNPADAQNPFTRSLSIAYGQTLQEAADLA